jgi:hypothetical protein
MIEMNRWATEAISKLKEGKKKVSGQKEKFMAPAVAAQLESFCRQDAEFAQAVVQGGTFSDCMKAVADGVGNCISDLDAYKKAVQFYFPGAEVKMQLTIDLIGAAAGAQEPEAIPVAEPAEEKPKVISLDMDFDLSSFF